MFHHKPSNIKRKLNNMNQVMDIEKLNELNLLKKNEFRNSRKKEVWMMKTRN